MVDIVIDSDGVYELDVSGYLCPFPVLKAAKVLRDLGIGDCLRVLSTDSGSWEDFFNFALGGDCSLLDRDFIDGVYVYLLRRD